MLHYDIYDIPNHLRDPNIMVHALNHALFPIQSQQNHKPERQISITWIPGHMDIDGNERADSEAKQAATTPKASPPFRYTPMKACRVQYIRIMAKEQWNKLWLESTTTTRQRRITERQGIKMVPRVYNNLPSRKNMRTNRAITDGHCGLNSHLHRIGKTDNPSCECGYKMESVEHFLLECKNYKEPRKELRRRVGSGKMKVTSLFGDTKLLKYTLEYIKATEMME